MTCRVFRWRSPAQWFPRASSRSCRRFRLAGSAGSGLGCRRFRLVPPVPVGVPPVPVGGALPVAAPVAAAAGALPGPAGLPIADMSGLGGKGVSTGPARPGRR